MAAAVVPQPASLVYLYEHALLTEMAMGYDRTASKRAVSVSLNQDLIRQARIYTPDLSRTLEDLLSDFVERERCRQEDAALDPVVDALNAFHAEHGLLSDEFPGL